MRPMLPRKIWLLALGTTSAAATALVLVAACSQPPETSFGNPAGLRRDNIPGEGGVEKLICTGVAISDGGGGGGGDGGNCAVSFSRDLFPLVVGPWKCVDAKCHGGTSPPTISGANAAAAYASMAAYTIKGSPHPYINPDGGGEPEKSDFLCNMLSQCGQGMPQSSPTVPSRAATKDEACRIDAWLRCGAPNN